MHTTKSTEDLHLSFGTDTKPSLADLFNIESLEFQGIALFL